MRKLYLLLFAVVFFAAQAIAQRVVTGKVTDEKNNPIGNASIVVTGTSAGTITKADGTYSLNVPAGGKTITISYLDMNTQTFTVGTKTSINASLIAANKSLDEVVVVGYGSGRKKSDVVGSVTTVNAKKIQERPTANAFDALQGKVAGLQVFTSSGEPSATSSLRLHGVGSLGASSTPLYVMDGIPVAPGTVVSLNPEDFETISVLKDASATSIYGSRAANGVILLTTKKGKVNTSQITVQTQYGTSNLSETAGNFFDGFMNTKQLTDFWVATAYRTQAQIDALLLANPNDTKWGTAYYRENSPTYQLNLNLSGGGNKTSYYVSGSYFKQDGQAYRSGFERYTLRSNINSTVNDWLAFGMNLSMGYDERETNQYGSNSTNRGLALLAPPFYSPNDPTGKPYELIPGWGRYHPDYLADKLPSKSNNVQFNPSGYMQITPAKNLTLKTQMGIEAYDFRTSSGQLPSFIGSLNNGNAAESFSRGVSKTITNTAEYKFDIVDKHNFTVLAGHEFIDDVTTAFGASSTGHSDDRLLLLGSGPTSNAPSHSRSEFSYLSYFSRLNYNLNNKYYIDLSIRQDESSRFGIDNRKATFWSVGGMWNAKKENFLSNINWLSDLTVKASWGTSGNSSIGNYDALPLVGTNQYDAQTGFGISAAGNPQLSWETQEQLNFGFNFSLFRRANFQIEYYNRETTDMLIGVPFPFTSGFSQLTSNVGSLSNTGFDVAIDVDVIRTKNAYFTPYANFNYNSNEVTELFQGKQYWIIPNTGVSWAVGQPVSYFYPVFSQINPTTGNPEWYLPNSNPDLIVNLQNDKSKVTSTFSTAALQQTTGLKRQPPFNGGFGFSGGISGFYTQCDISFSKGKYMINNDRYFYENPNQFPGFNQSTSILNYWKKAGDVTQFPRYGVQFTQFDTRLIEDASFMRLKSLTVGYNIPQSILQKTKFFTAVKFYVTGRNLWTITKYLGPDPEVDTNVTLGANPNTKQVALGIDFQF